MYAEIGRSIHLLSKLAKTGTVSIAGLNITPHKTKTDLSPSCLLATGGPLSVTVLTSSNGVTQTLSSDGTTLTTNTPQDVRTSADPLFNSVAAQTSGVLNDATLYVASSTQSGISFQSASGNLHYDSTGPALYFAVYDAKVGPYDCANVRSGEIQHCATADQIQLGYGGSCTTKLNFETKTANTTVTFPHASNPSVAYRNIAQTYSVSPTFNSGIAFNAGGTLTAYVAPTAWTPGIAFGGVSFFFQNI